MNDYIEKQISVQYCGFDWVIDVEYLTGFNNGDPRDEIEPQLLSWSIDCIYYDNGSYEFSTSTVKELKFWHQKEIREQIIYTIFN